MNNVLVKLEEPEVALLFIEISKGIVSYNYLLKDLIVYCLCRKLLTKLKSGLVWQN
jgi:hypothetical protein